MQTHFSLERENLTPANCTSFLGGGAPDIVQKRELVEAEQLSSFSLPALATLSKTGAKHEHDILWVKV